MAQACLSVLLRLDDHMDKETIESYPLARYAGKFVFEHAKFEDVLSHINDGLDYLLDQDKPHFNTWFWLNYGDFDSKRLDMDLESTSDSSESLSDSPSSNRPLPKYPPRVSLLYYALGEPVNGERVEPLWLAQLLISKRPRDLDVSDAFGYTPLHIAVHTDDNKVLQMLIERTTNINGQDNKGCSPLHHAMCESNHEHSARLLLDHGANVDAQNNNGSTPLHLAASKTSEEIVQLLIENTTNIDLRNKSRPDCTAQSIETW
jgi:ankyrin repeat protein